MTVRTIAYSATALDAPAQSEFPSRPTSTGFCPRPFGTEGGSRPLGADGVSCSFGAEGVEPYAESSSARVGIDWNAAMKRHDREVVVSLLAKGVRPALAKELAQEAWLRIIQASRAGRLERLQLPGVVIAQAQFLALDERRRGEQRFPHLSLDVEEPAGRAALEARVAARDELRTIEKVVGRSHPNARRVFELMYGGRAHTAAEIAEQLGLSTQRVRQIASELRQKVRQALAGERSHGG